MTFPDAVKHLATKMGIPIPEEEVEDPTGMTARRDAARAALREAADFYRKTLSASDGAPVRTFYERRGFSADIQERFGLGAAPAAWDHLLTHLEANGFTRQHLEDAGLIIVKDDGKVYDWFRGRAMFTIRDDSGRVVGFSARTLSNDPDTPKYINSPQSMVFDKSRVLYGLDLAKRSIIEHKTVHVVEGQADVIAMHQGGFLSTVASSGTALTPDHVKLLKKYADTMVLVFDADSAGQKAMSRGIEIGLAGGMEVRCVVLPSGEDPDSMIKKNGVTAMSDLLAHAMPWMTYQTERFKKEGALSDPVQQANAVRTLLTWIGGIPDRLRHQFFVRQLAETFQLQEPELMRELSKISQTSAHQQTSTPANQHTSTPARQRTSTPAPQHTVTLLPSELALLRVALTVEHGLAMLLHTYHIDAATFITPQGQRIFERIIIAEQEHHDVFAQLIEDDALSGEDRDLLRKIVGTHAIPSERWRAFDVEVPDHETARMVRDALLGLALQRTSTEIDVLMSTLSSLVEEEDRKRAVFRLQKLVDRREDLKRRYADTPHDLSWLDADTASPS
jgi:DNA primase